MIVEFDSMIEVDLMGEPPADLFFYLSEPLPFQVVNDSETSDPRHSNYSRSLVGGF